jgi:predicted dinucleotide-utilizing enzyme
VPSGALAGLDAVRAAAEGAVGSVVMRTRKPPAGLAQVCRRQDDAHAAVRGHTARAGKRHFRLLR